LSTLSVKVKKCCEKASSEILLICLTPDASPNPNQPRHHRATPAVMSGLKCVIKTTHSPQRRRHGTPAASATGPPVIPDGHQRQGFSTYKCCRLGLHSGRCPEHFARHVTSPRPATRPTTCAVQRLGFSEAAGPLHVPRKGFARQRGRLPACVSTTSANPPYIMACHLAVVRGRPEDEDDDGTRI
jgi:hypothetical protein